MPFDHEFYEQYRAPLTREEEEEYLGRETVEAASQLAAEAAREGAKRVGGGYKTRAGFVPDPTVKAHMTIAEERAEAQFRGWPAMPEDMETAARFPGIDPVGKYSALDMRFAQREARLEAFLQTRPPEVRDYLQTVRRNPQSQAVEFSMREAAKVHRRLTRASKLCLDPDGRRLLHAQARMMESDLPVLQYDLMLQGMEYAAGVKEGPLPRDVADFYTERLKAPIPQAILQLGQMMENAPTRLEVEFQNFDHQMSQRRFSSPHNWGKSAKELGDQELPLDLEARAIPPYALETADRALAPAFQNAEKNGMSRADLIIAGGMTVRERMEKEGLREPTAGQIREYTNTYVAAALMAGERVEAFVPDKNGRLPAQPTQITKKGYEPSPLKRVRLNAWERFFSKHGFFKEKAAQAKAYQETAAARERVAGRFHDRMPTAQEQEMIKPAPAERAPEKQQQTKASPPRMGGRRH